MRQRVDYDVLSYGPAVIAATRPLGTYTMRRRADVAPIDAVAAAIADAVRGEEKSRTLVEREPTGLRRDVWRLTFGPPTRGRYSRVAPFLARVVVALAAALGCSSPAPDDGSGGGAADPTTCREVASDCAPLCAHVVATCPDAPAGDVCTDGVILRESSPCGAWLTCCPGAP